MAPTSRPLSCARPAGPLATTFPMLPKFVPPRGVIGAAGLETGSGWRALELETQFALLCRLISMIAAST